MATDHEIRAVYGNLCQEFEYTQKLPKGRTELEYLSIEQVVTRLNDVLGFGHWHFEVKDHGSDGGGAWALGRGGGMRRE